MPGRTWTPSKTALTDREVEVVRAYLKCDSSKIAAAELGISDSMVRRHFGHVRDKTGLRSRAELAKLVNPPEPARVRAARRPRPAFAGLTLWNLGE